MAIKGFNARTWVGIAGQAIGFAKSTRHRSIQLTRFHRLSRQLSP